MQSEDATIYRKTQGLIRRRHDLSEDVRVLSEDVRNHHMLSEDDRKPTKNINKYASKSQKKKSENDR